MTRVDFELGLGILYSSYDTSKTQTSDFDWNRAMSCVQDKAGRQVKHVLGHILYSLR